MYVRNIWKNKKKGPTKFLINNRSEEPRLNSSHIQKSRMPSSA